MPSLFLRASIVLGAVVSAAASSIAAGNRPPNARKDTDRDGDPVAAILLVESVEHGVLAAFLDGSFTYTADPGYVGRDRFKYLAGDGHGGSDTATVIIRVRP